MPKSAIARANSRRVPSGIVPRGQPGPLGSGFANLGLEGWYFQQVSCDSGAGATLGCFKGRTAGIGPVLGYIQPIGQDKLIFEAKWLPELDTKNRLKGDYVWLKMVYKF